MIFVHHVPIDASMNKNYNNNNNNKEIQSSNEFAQKSVDTLAFIL